MRISESDLEAITKRGSVKVADAVVPAKKTPMQRWQALGRLPKDRMNGTEADFSEWLEAERLAGRVLSWKFHPMRVRLADNAYYEVDFLACMADMTLTIFEVKGGFTSDKGQLKIRLCGEVLPYFRMMKATKLPKKSGGGFKFEEF